MPKLSIFRESQGGHWSEESQGNLIFLQDQKGQRILQIGQGNFKYQESQENFII